jgi:Tfp pilus assembly protein PilN
MAGVKDKGVISVVDADLLELDEVNFTVLEDGFPLFSRDMILKGGLEEPAAAEAQDQGMLLEKLKTEIRISLDYYNRKFPNKKIEDTFFITNKDYQADLEAFAKEIGIEIKFVDVNKCIGKPVAFSLSLIKAYSCSLSKLVKSTIKINLLAVKAMAAREPAMPALNIANLFKGLRLDPKMVLWVLLICGAAFGLGLYQKLPLQKEIANIRSIRPKVVTVSPNASYGELTRVDSECKMKLDALNSLIKKQLYLTEILDNIPRAMPEGVWLTDFSFNKKEDGIELVLHGVSYSADSTKEFEIVDNFVERLKNNQTFAQYFKEIKIVSLNRTSVRDTDVASFIISCQNLKEKREE